MENTFDDITFDFGVDILLWQIPLEETPVQQHEEIDNSISDFLNNNKEVKIDKYNKSILTSLIIIKLKKQCTITLHI